MTPSELIAEAVRLWSCTRKGYRDGTVEVGRLVRKFLAARLAEGTGLNEQQRRLRRITRRDAVADAAAALGIRDDQANTLAALGAVDELLRPEGGWGSLSMSCLRAMRALIGRPNRGKIGRNAGSDVAALEVWAPRIPTATAFAARAVAESWGLHRVKAELKKLKLPGADGSSRDRKPRPVKAVSFAPKLYTTGEVAPMFNVVPRTVVKWMDSGRLGSYRIPGSLHRRSTAPDIIAFCESNGLPVPLELETEMGRGAVVAFGLSAASAPAGVSVLDAFGLGRACGSALAVCLVGDEEGLASAVRAGQFVRASHKSCRIVLILSEGNAGFVPPPAVFSDVIGLPADLSFLAPNKTRHEVAAV